MLNAEREQNYRVQRGQWKLPVPAGDVLTPQQRKRIHKKQHAHAHFAAGHCDRCLPGYVRDTERTTAAPTEEVTKWERT